MIIFLKKKNKAGDFLSIFIIIIKMIYSNLLKLNLNLRINLKKNTVPSYIHFFVFIRSFLLLLKAKNL